MLTKEAFHKMLGITHNVGSFLRRDDGVVNDNAVIQSATKWSEGSHGMPDPRVPWDSSFVGMT